MRYISCTLLSPSWLGFLSREGLDLLSWHSASACSATSLFRGLAGWAQGCAIPCQLFFTCWIAAPELLVAQIPLTKILLNLLLYCYNWLRSVNILYPFSKLLFFFFFWWQYTRNTLTVCGGHADLQDVAVERGKQNSVLKGPLLPYLVHYFSQSLPWTCFVIWSQKWPATYGNRRSIG